MQQPAHRRALRPLARRVALKVLEEPPRVSTARVISELGPHSAKQAMAGSLFITGATGFLGRHFLARLEPERRAAATCLVRSAPSAGTYSGVRCIQGDLLEPASYASAIGPDTVVVHLAAATGKAGRAEYQRVNVDGTRTLLDAGRARGARRFVFISSVAARYGDLRSYPYGQSKRDAEALVHASGLSYLIVRPTIVLGPESPIWRRLRQLSAGRVVPLIGNGKTRVQPIHVDDAADALVEMTRADGATGVFELAGPDALSIADLLERIHTLTHRSAMRLLPVPYQPIRILLGLLEKRWQRYLPVTAGQLSLFVNDSTVEAASTLRAMWPRMMRIDDIIHASESAHV